MTVEWDQEFEKRRAKLDAEFQARHANSKPAVVELFSRPAVEGDLRGDIAIGCDDDENDDEDDDKKQP